MKKLLIVLTAISFLFFSESCTKGNSINYPPQINVSEFWKCNESENFDSTKLAAGLVGSWQWIAASCYWSGQTTEADKDVKITFTSSGTFLVTENSALVSQGNWGLVIVDSGILGLSMDHPSQYLHGRILLCDNQVVFNDSYIDGCDNLFLRK